MQKQRKIPQRQCVGCRTMKDKKALVRIVKTPGGRDLRGHHRQEGRTRRLHLPRRRSVCSRPGSPGRWSGPLRRPSGRTCMRRCRRRSEAEGWRGSCLCWVWRTRPDGWRSARSRWAPPPGPRKRGSYWWPSDAAAGSVRRAMSFANTGNCLCLRDPATKDELGRALGRTSCAMAAVTDIGFADAVAKKLAALEPEKYESAAERMAVKAQRRQRAPAGAAQPRKEPAHGEEKSDEARAAGGKEPVGKGESSRRRGTVRRSGKSPADPTAGRAAPPQGSGRRRRLVSGLRAAVR